jgi:hypothetical protein
MVGTNKRGPQYFVFSTGILVSSISYFRGGPVLNLTRMCRAGCMKLGFDVLVACIAIMHEEQVLAITF